MSFSRINLWSEGDIPTVRVMSRLLNDMVGQGNCHTKLIGALDWESLLHGLNIFCRVCDPRYSWLPAYLKKNNVPYVFYLDDNLWKITGSGELARHYQSSGVVSTLDGFVRGAEFVITHNQVMVEFIESRFPEVLCKLLPVPFDVSLTDVKSKDFSSSLSNKPVVGYAGSYKEEEFKLLEKVINQFGRDRPEVRFEFVGGISDNLRSLNNVQWFPGFSDYAAFLSFKMSRNWSVGLAPLMDSGFNAAKTNNKFREYGGCRIPAVYSRTSPYVECVSQEESGLLVENTVDAWVSAIKRLVDDSGLRDRIKKSAFAFVEFNYSHQAVSPAWREALDTVADSTRMKRFARLRFNHVKRYYLDGYGTNAVALENANLPSLCKFLLRNAVGSLFAKITIRRVFAILILFMLMVTNFYLIKAGF